MASSASKVAAAVTTLINNALKHPKNVQTAAHVMKNAKHLRACMKTHLEGGGKSVRLSIKVP
jgi:hypothetical protein